MLALGDNTGVARVALNPKASSVPGCDLQLPASFLPTSLFHSQGPTGPAGPPGFPGAVGAKVRHSSEHSSHGRGVSSLPKPEGPRVAREKPIPQYLCPEIPFSDLGVLILGLLSLLFTPHLPKVRLGTYSGFCHVLSSHPG